MNKRLYYLDNLKVFLTALVVFHHANIPFSHAGDWGYSPSNPAEFIPNLWHFNSINATFFMGLFFFISGFFVPGSYDRQGGKTFCLKKLLRLGIPLLLVTMIISSVDHCLSFAHVWFVENLLIFSLLYALVRQFAKPIDSKNAKSRLTILAIVVFATVLGLLQLLIRGVSNQDNWIMFLGFIRMEPAHYLQYASLFVLGILAYRLGWLEKLKNSIGIGAVIVSILFCIGDLLRGENAWGGFVWHWFGMYEAFMCVSICIALIWIFREFGNWSGSFWKWCSAQTYGAYIFHLFVLLSIEYAMDNVAMPVFLKFILEGSLATVFSFAITWLFRLIPGVKKVL